MKRSCVLAAILLITVVSASVSAIINTCIMDTLAVSTQQFENHSSVQQQNVKKLQDEIIQAKNEQKLREQQKENLQENIWIIVNRLTSQMTDLKQELTRMEEKDSVMYGQYQEDINKIARKLTDIYDEIDYIDVTDGSVHVSNTYESLYYCYEIPESESGSESETEQLVEDDKPEHVHSFDQYGNCTDEICTEHRE